MPNPTTLERERTLPTAVTLDGEAAVAVDQLAYELGEQPDMVVYRAVILLRDVLGMAQRRRK